MRPKPLSHELNSEVRIAEHKKQQVFDDIHILQEHEGITNEQIVFYLVKQNSIETETEAWRWLRKYKEHKMAGAEKDYLAQIEKLSGEIEEINKTLARMEIN